MDLVVAQILVLQVAVAALTLGFGLLALRVAPGPGTSTRTGAWYLAGITFTLDGLLGTVHASAGAAAMAIAGRGTPFYLEYLRWTPLGDDARTLLVLGFAVGLVWLVLLERPVPARRVVLGSAAGLVVAGAMVGLAEGPLEQGGVHFSVLSLLGAVMGLLMFVALYRGMLRGTVDWLLWTALALYAAHQALSSNFQTALAWAGYTGGWSPPVLGIMWSAMVVACVMLACSMRRLAIARAGGDPPGLLERLRG
ncbi:hypothetical protein SAMN05216486_1203 [bacterium JGI 053]|nr:hypothetical protein SAMN05216486_1203 [bacterium JGI 053]